MKICDTPVRRITGRVRPSGIALELLDIFRGGEPGDLFELTVEVGDVVVSAFVADLRDGQFAHQQQLAGVSDA